jgi:hypothetical protein
LQKHFDACLPSPGFRDRIRNRNLGDADLNSATLKVQNCLPTNAYLATAGINIQLMLNCDGVAEYGIYAKSGGTATVQMTGRLPREYI